MLKKRIIFTLLYDNGQFVLSRNFRLQRVGNLDWLKLNYNFSHISFSIDELVVLDVSRGNKISENFCNALKQLSQGCFVPIAAGGGVLSVDAARNLLRSGADKVIVNTALYYKDSFINELASEFGQQCVVASVDVKHTEGEGYQAWSDLGRICQPGTAKSWIEYISSAAIGELYINSIDRDGTGQGYDLSLLDLLPINMKKSVIIAGGVGNSDHLGQGLADKRVDGVATAHLFNFIGNGLKNARELLISRGFDLPQWDASIIENFKKYNNKYENR